MSFIKELWKKFRKSEAIVYPTFNVNPSNCLDEDKKVGIPIKARESYFEVSLTEQFLKNRREYWSEYIPLSLFLMEFIYSNEKKTFPFVVGPDLLKTLDKLEGDESIRYRNTRVLGPTPYNGDNIVLFAGLFRVVTKNWAANTISFFEEIAGTLDKGKLLSYSKIAKPLLSGIEGLFGMGKQVQFRIGQRDEFKDSGIHDNNIFKSGYWVMIRNKTENINKSNFWVKEGQLLYGTKKAKLKPYKESDYLLIEINGSSIRNDYTTFDFHDHWEEAREAVIRGNLEQGDTEMENLKVKLYRSVDIIESQKEKLDFIYRGKYEELKGRFSVDQSPQIVKPNSLTKGFVKGKKYQSLFTNKNLKILSEELNKGHIEDPEFSFLNIDQDYLATALNHPGFNKKEVIAELRSLKSSPIIL